MCKHGVRRRLLGLALTGSASLLLAACASVDSSTYESSVNLPTTITVEDPYTHHVYWGMDIPVGRALTIDLDRSGDFEWFSVSGRPATSLNWKLTGPGKDESGSLALPGTPVVVVVSYRPSPEYPADYTGPRPGQPGIARPEKQAPAAWPPGIEPQPPAPAPPPLPPAPEPLPQPEGVQPGQAPPPAESVAPSPPADATVPPPADLQQFDEALEPQPTK